MSPNSELEPIIASGYSEGRARFGDLGLDPEVFAKRIEAIIQKHLGANPPMEASVSFAKSLHSRDLYLATACAQHSLYPATDPATGVPSEHAGRAWKMLESTYRGFIRDLARYFFRKGFISQDLADNILADLFLPDRSGTSRIVSYDGRSSLSTWLRVVISNRAINAKRCSATMQTVEILADIPDEPALERIDSGLRTKRYQEPLKDSLTLACRRLTLRERLILLWRYEDGLQLGQIARLLDIHQSNVTRQLDRLQGKLREHVIEILSTRHGLSLDAIEECLKDIVENPQTVAILEFIKGKQGPSQALQATLPVPGARQGNTFAAKPPESDPGRAECNNGRWGKYK
ncbi:MAG TPA: sigma-70 family RNA polymerase sigma factor [Candidatus Angelobacter sp.]|nr:sigma-70 family RNA polymerase sigma factor [Candidatus Angelobacter sp.]